jgi:hypothetical protein
MNNESLSTWDVALLHILARVRGLRPETAFKYSKLKIPGGAEAVRKRMERLCNKGFLAKSPLPRGGQIFRLSHKGVRLTGAPPAFANSPSLCIAAEMLSVSAFGYADEFLFLTATERDALMADCAKDSEGKLTGRFLLRSLTSSSVAVGPSLGTHLHLWLAEVRPAEELAKRVDTIVQKLNQVPVCAEFIRTGIFGITIAVPSRGVKAALDGRKFPVPTAAVVVDELQDLIAC